MGTMKEQMEEFLANLFSAGYKRETASALGYEYAVALQLDQQRAEDRNVSAEMMATAARLLNDALPGARRLYDRRNQMW